MKKKNIINLIRYHIENNDTGFRTEAIEVAKDFDNNNDEDIAKYIMSLLSNTNSICPQFSNENTTFLNRVELNYIGLPMPKSIEEDIKGVANAINTNIGINKFLFYGKPGTGKTETAKQLARILERELYIANFEEIIDSKLGQTSKNIITLFDEINSFQRPDKVLVLFDEIDSIALNRINSNDLREMGRATSTLFKGLEQLKDSVVLIATTNLYKNLDDALIRRFDYSINFDRYSKKDLYDVGLFIYNEIVNKLKIKGDSKLFKKILANSKSIYYPGDLKNIIKTSIAFSDANNKSEHLTKLYKKLNNEDSIDIEKLSKEGYTLREIQTLSGVSKSKVARDIKRK